MVIEFRSSVKYTPTQVSDLKDSVVQKFGVSKDRVTVEITEVTGSRRQLTRGRQLDTEYEVTMTIESDSEADANALTADVKQEMKTFDSASTLLPGLLTLPTVSSQTV